ncbi:GGDEF domain-containing protein [Shewanella atlantica]|uniref:GGDEF domain-containing protein n=1 Tax=Shewanella atlantica TaxID=271099 RepID=UPI00373580E2
MLTRYSKQFLILAFSLMLTLMITRNSSLVDDPLSIESAMEGIRVIICLCLLFLIESTGDQRQIYTPLLAGGSALYLGNLLNLLDDFYDLSQAPLELIEDLFETAGLISVLVGVTLWTRHHQEQFKYLMKLATSDPLTGLLNRRAAITAIKEYGGNGEETHLEPEKSGETHCTMIMDLDHFKHVNDALGHDAGDKLLCDISGILQQSLKSCVIARWGGEEFLIYSMTGSKQEALELALSVKYQIGHHPFSYEGTPMKITVSIGVSTCSCEDFSLFEEIKHADIALYQAKAAGRDYVQMAK